MEDDNEQRRGNGQAPVVKNYYQAPRPQDPRAGWNNMEQMHGFSLGDQLSKAMNFSKDFEKEVNVPIRQINAQYRGQNQLQETRNQGLAAILAAIQGGQFGGNAGSLRSLTYGRGLPQARQSGPITG